ncbi:metal-sensing transcriptional repressor [Candidatus Daviesbacteria bacterium]|nr:metal-sensing transcriptional repressor [Candidatus Daviesbacteria bacterium]
MAYRPKDTQQRILHRLQIAQGHLRKVIKMVEDGEYCIDVIHQSQAVQRALEEADGLTLENHLKTCVVDHIKKGETDVSISEIMNVFKQSKQT